ncbi:hypothetical protein EDP2_3959 [Enterobacter cloacae S611]|uniref:Uncharacterized protein n=1 Tax=Enterobacter cloacae S611 TaxID=1399146 RepID=A0ABP2ZWK8_ENTCL|nr:hypothetical protein EDP2_3959 [Enterobacter cloacae S611]
MGQIAHQIGRRLYAGSKHHHMRRNGTTIFQRHALHVLIALQLRWLAGHKLDAILLMQLYKVATNLFAELRHKRHSMARKDGDIDILVTQRRRQLHGDKAVTDDHQLLLILHFTEQRLRLVDIT